MLSVLIPIYNFDCSNLIKEIIYQCKACKISFELIIIDDDSLEVFKNKNREITKTTHTYYTELSQNIGRSKIRNLLANKAQYSNLLFLDCDSKITNKDFIAKYIPYFDSEKIVYGGRCYTNAKPTLKQEVLRWKYGIKRETILAKDRANNTYQSFLTNNFLCPKVIFDSLSFNEQLTGYGHEDTLFSYELQANKIELIHIDNPLTHIGLETTDVFLNKTQEGIKNLLKITSNCEKIGNNVRLFRKFNQLKKIKMAIIFRVIYFIFLEKIILINLKSSNPSLLLFDLFKLNCIIKEDQEFNKSK